MRESVKMKRKFILPAILLFVLLATMPAEAHSSYKGLYYEAYNGAITITGVDESFYDDIDSIDVFIPEEINQIPVKSIANDAFNNNTKIKSVSMGSNVVSVGEAAFANCQSLADIFIADSVRTIGEYAFYNTAFYNDIRNWEEDDSLYVGNHLIEAGYSFEECNVKEGTVTIAAGACAYRDELSLVKLPESLKSICDYAFAGCTALESIRIPMNVECFGNEIFLDCNALRYIYTLDQNFDVSISDNVTVYDGSEGFPYPLATPDDLYYISKISNAGFTFEDYWFCVAQNIDFNGEEWNPIGQKYDYPFMGNIDGNGKYINNYVINDTYGNIDGYAGFFCRVEQANIKNLQLQNFKIVIANPTKNAYVGGLCGSSYATSFENCNVYGNIVIYNDKEKAYEVLMAGVTAVSAFDVINDVDISCNISYYGNKDLTLGGTQAKIGGISAYSWSQISGCDGDGKIFARGKAVNVGGIVGEQAYNDNSYIENCNVHGNIELVRAKSDDVYMACGGIVGKNQQIINNCRSYSAITIFYDGNIDREADDNTLVNRTPHCGQIYGLGKQDLVSKCLAYGNILVKAFDEYHTTVSMLPTIQPELVNGFYQYKFEIEVPEEIESYFIIAFYEMGVVVQTDLVKLNFDNYLSFAEGKVKKERNASGYCAYVWNTDMLPLCVPYSGGIIKK